MFKGKSFKAGWSKGFNFYSLDCEDRESNNELILKTIDASANFDPLKVCIIYQISKDNRHQFGLFFCRTF